MFPSFPITEMYFVTKVKFSNLLFKGLDINNTAELVGACIITFLAAIACEALKLLQLYLTLRLKENPLAHVQHHDGDQVTDSINNSRAHDEVVLLSSLRFPANLRQIQAQKLMFHILNTLNHMVSFFWAYMLMLLVMTFSTWLTISVIAGCGAGYFIFGALRRKLEIKFSERPAPPAQSPPCREPQAQDSSETLHM